jgi:hypothetical protein
VISTVPPAKRHTSAWEENSTAVFRGIAGRDTCAPVLSVKQKNGSDAGAAAQPVSSSAASKIKNRFIYL